MGLMRRAGAAALIGLAGLGAVGVASGVLESGAQAEGLVPWQDADAVALGGGLYAEACAACHGAALEGQVADWRRPGADGLMPAPPHDETGHTWHHPDALLLDIVTRGTEAVVGRGYRSAMPGFGETLTREEILAVLAFIKSTWPADVIEVHDRINAEAARARQ